MTIIINNSDQNKSDQFSDEVISPMFGYDYKDRIVPSKVKKVEDFSLTKAQTSYLEKQIEEEVEIQTKIAKAKEYQETFQSDTDVLKEYHKQKENQELKEMLPSNYLNFRDNLGKNLDDSLISMFDDTTSASDSTISEIIDDILVKNQIN